MLHKILRTHQKELFFENVIDLRQFYSHDTFYKQLIEAMRSGAPDAEERFQTEYKSAYSTQAAFNFKDLISYIKLIWADNFKYIFIFLLQENGKAIPHQVWFQNNYNGSNPKQRATPNEDAASLVVSFQQEASTQRGAPTVGWFHLETCRRAEAGTQSCIQPGQCHRVGSSNQRSRRVEIIPRR